jgi:hypothetical protein
MQILAFKSPPKYQVVRRHLATPFKKLSLNFSTEAEERMFALSSLRQSNIHASSLFRGLDGHARSMRVDALLFARQLKDKRFVNEGHWETTTSSLLFQRTPRCDISRSFLSFFLNFVHVKLSLD